MYTLIKQQANNTKLNGMKFAVCLFVRLLYYFRRISVLKYTLLFTCKWWSFKKKKSLAIVDMKIEIIKKAVTEFFIFFSVWSFSSSFSFCLFVCVCRKLERLT